MIKIEVLLATTPGSADPSRALAELSAGLRASVGPGVAVRAVVHDPTALSDLSHGEETEAAAGFGGVLELVAPSEDELAGALTAVGELLAGRTGFDRERSAIVAGTEHVVVEGDRPLMLAMALTRKAGMSREEFQQYWATKHAELGRRVPGSEGYRQVHTDPTLTARARSAAGVGGQDFDGVALAYYSDPAAFRSIMANTAVVERLLEDERRFIDHERSTLVVGWGPPA